MTPTEAIQRLLHHGAGHDLNLRELTDAMLAVKMKSPIADKRCLRAILNALTRIDDDKLSDDMAGVIAKLSGAETRGTLPREDEPASAQIQGRVTPERKKHWNNFARENDLTLWGMIQETVDQRTGHREE